MNQSNMCRLKRNIYSLQFNVFIKNPAANTDTKDFILVILARMLDFQEAVYVSIWGAGHNYPQSLMLMVSK